MKTAEFEIYKDAKKEYRWRFRAANGQILADSGEGYSSRIDCEIGIALVRELAMRSPIKG